MWVKLSVARRLTCLLSLYNIEVVVRFGGLLVLDVFLPCLICHVPAAYYPVPREPTNAAPITLLQESELREQSVRAFSFRVLNGSRDQQPRRNRDQHVDIVAVYRSRMYLHIFAHRDLPQQLPASHPGVTSQYLISVLCCPYQVVFEIPRSMASTFKVVHTPRLHHHANLMARLLKARGLRIPYRGL